ncbi:MAG: 50S ribosomal protein L6 [Anaerolineae bacterium]|nr:50S ribosomal protein L6 [Anaerolineae bacterium]
MSRIGKMPISIPAGVAVEIAGSCVTVRGPKGELMYEFHPEMSIAVQDGVVRVERPSDSRQFRALHGLTRALLNNMVIGVTQGYSITLEIHGTGYRAELQGKNLVMNLGYSHPVVMEPPKDVIFNVNPRANTITVEGIDKQVVGQVAAEIRGWRPVEPYLGKGIRYAGELVRRKAGKAGKAG